MIIANSGRVVSSARQKQARTRRLSDPIQKPEAPSPSSWVLLRRLVVEHVRDYAGKLGLAALATLAAAATGANAWLLQIGRAHV